MSVSKTAYERFDGEFTAELTVTDYDTQRNAHFWNGMDREALEIFRLWSAPNLIFHIYSGHFEQDHPKIFRERKTNKASFLIKGILCPICKF